MEEVDTITVAVSGIDINKVEPLDTRRLVTFINHYLATTVSFLNHFATQCESKLDRMQQQLHRVECRLKLLECKLASIPGVPNTPTAESASTFAGTQGPSTSASTSAPVPGPSNSSNNTAPTTSTHPMTNPSATSSIQQTNSATTSSTSGPSSDNLNPTEKQNGQSDVVPEGEDTENDEEESNATSGTSTANASSSAKDDPRYAKYFKMVTVGVPVPAVKQKMLSEGVDPTILDH